MKYTFHPTGTLAEHRLEVPTRGADHVIVLGGWAHRCGDGSLSRALTGKGDRRFPDDDGYVAATALCCVCNAEVGELRAHAVSYWHNGERQGSYGDTTFLKGSASRKAAAGG